MYISSNVIDIVVQQMLQLNIRYVKKFKNSTFGCPKCGQIKIYAIL